VQFAGWLVRWGGIAWLRLELRFRSGAFLMLSGKRRARLLPGGGICSGVIHEFSSGLLAMTGRRELCKKGATHSGGRG
jgi:hypothetical protein